METYNYSTLNTQDSLEKPCKDKYYEQIENKFDVQYFEKDIKLEQIIHNYCSLKEKSKDSSNLSAFYLINLAQVAKLFKQWTENLPRVRPYYAVKCNQDPALIQLIYQMGGGFDCASISEMNAVKELTNLRFNEDVIFANPCKQTSHMKHAKELGIEWTTVDSIEELNKLKETWPECKVVVRIMVDDSKSVNPFSSKYGLPVDNCESFLKAAKELELNVVGVSFHVGSGCYDETAFQKAIYDARKVFDVAKEIGYDLSLLDIGGGFPGTDDIKPSFKDITKIISPLLDELFDKNVKIIAEPGRYFATSCHTLVCNIFGKKKNKKENLEFLYYCNDGIYNSFSCLYFDHANLNLIPFSTKRQFKEDEKLFTTKIFGPTCDSLDVILTNIKYPELNIGDWLYQENFGAYTRSISTNFNGFNVSHQHYYWKE